MPNPFGGPFVAPPGTPVTTVDTGRQREISKDNPAFDLDAGLRDSLIACLASTLGEPDPAKALLVAKRAVARMTAAELTLLEMRMRDRPAPTAHTIESDYNPFG